MRFVLAGAVLLGFGLASNSSAQSPPAIRISEFVSDAAEPGGDGAFEWVELENSSSETVTLNGWKISDAKLSDAITATTIPPGGFLVIAGKSAVFPPEVAVVRVADGAIGGSLNNDGDTIRIVDGAGDEVDAVVYGAGADRLAPPAGQSLARAPDGEWRLAIRPTPGAPNAIASDADIGQVFPVPVEFRTGESRTHPAAWIILAGCAGVGLTGLVTMAYRTIRKKLNRAS